MWPDHAAVGALVPGGGTWLTAVPRRRAIDLIRRKGRLANRHATPGRELEIQREQDGEAAERAALDDSGDDLLRLMFAVCLPVPGSESQVALTLLHQGRRG